MALQVKSIQNHCKFCKNWIFLVNILESNLIAIVLNLCISFSNVSKKTVFDFICLNSYSCKCSVLCWLLKIMKLTLYQYKKHNIFKRSKCIRRFLNSVARLRDLSSIPRFWGVSWQQDFCKNRTRFLREIPRF